MYCNGCGKEVKEDEYKPNMSIYDTILFGLPICCSDCIFKHNIPRKKGIDSNNESIKRVIYWNKLSYDNKAHLKQIAYIRIPFTRLKRLITSINYGAKRQYTPNQLIKIIEAVMTEIAFDYELHKRYNK